MSAEPITGNNRNGLFSFSIKKPILIITILFIISVLFKVLDTFVLRLDEQIGEALLTKLLGLALVIIYIWISGKKLKDIGFHSTFIWKSLAMAGIGFILVYIIAFIVQIIVFSSKGESAGLALTAVDPKTGMTGGFLFGLWLFFTNLINSGMEEGLFRGVMIRHLLVKLSGWGAILVSAGFFAIWHLGWPIRQLMDGTASLGEAAFGAFSLLLATFIAGIVYGYLYWKTDNQWGPFLAHTINNTLLNIIYFRTAAGLMPATSSMIYMMIVLLGYLGLVPIFRLLTSRFQMPVVKPWNE
jgi:membrane protease YdiL (CAAX protease family)